MAVQAYFTNFDQATIPLSAAKAVGVNPLFFQNTVAKLAGDSDTSTYLLCKGAPADARISELFLENDALSGATDCDIGLYDSKTGAVIDKDCISDGISLATAHTKAEDFDGAVALTHANSLKPLWELAGHTRETRHGSYDIVLTLNTAGGAAGSVTARGQLTPTG